MSSLSTLRQHPSFITDVSHQRLTLLDWNCIVLLFILIFHFFHFVIHYYQSTHSSYYPFIDHPFAIPFISFVICSSTYPIHLFPPFFLPSFLSFFMILFIFTIFVQGHHISQSQILRKVESRRTLKAEETNTDATQSTHIMKSRE